MSNKPLFLESVGVSPGNAFPNPAKRGVNCGELEVWPRIPALEDSASNTSSFSPVGDTLSPPQEESATNFAGTTSCFDLDAKGVSPPTETGAEDTQGTPAGSTEGVTGEVVTGGISKPVPGRGVDIATGSRKEKHIPSIDASRKSKL